MANEVAAQHVVWATLALVQLSYCIWHVLAKTALLAGVHPLILAFYREILALSCMYALAFKLDGELPWARFERRRLPIYLAMGLLSFGNIVGFIIALNFVTTFNSALLHPSIPVFAAVFAWSVGAERMTPTKASGVAVCALGALVTVAWGAADGSDESSNEANGAGDNVLLGNFILLLQCACMAGLLVTSQRELRRGVPPTTLTARYYSLGAVLTWLVCLAAIPPWGSSSEDGSAHASGYRIALTTPSALVAIAYGGCVSVTFVYCALAWATQQSSPTTAALSMTLQPPLNAVLSVLFMGRTLFSAGEVCGGFLVAGGLVITVRAQNAEGLGAARNDLHRSAEDELQRLDDAQANEHAARLDDDDDQGVGDEEDDGVGGVVEKLGSALDRPALFRGLGGSRMARDGDSDTTELVSRNSPFSSSSSPGIDDVLSFGGSPPRYERRPDVISTPGLSPVENASML